ncbi:MAG: TonB-dependent receptor [Sphingopyxis sp.]|nr:TonB-dependent receptor [Sphingopyxis sp.]
MYKKMNNAVSVFGLMLSPLILVAVPSAAYAQDEEAASAPNLGANEIIVTARKRDERLVDVPAVIQSFSAESLQAANIDDVKGVALRVPNFNITEQQQPGVALISVRGIGQARNGEPPVSLVVDGVQINNSYQITQQLVDVERIEILKGPQGALYGRNAIGGAIVITTRKPGDEFRGAASVGYGSGNDLKLSANISGPIAGEVLGFKAAVFYRDFKGDILNVNINKNANNDRQINIRAGLLFAPSDAIELDLRYSRLDSEGGGAWYSTPPVGRPNQVGPWRGSFNTEASRLIDDLSLKATIDLGGAAITSVTGYSKVSSAIRQDLDLSPAAGLNVFQGINTSAWSEELRIASTGKRPFQWLVGAYYIDIDYRIATDIIIPPPGANPATFQPTGSFVIPTGSVEQRKSYAGFGQLSYRFDSGIELTGAFRYDVDDQFSVTQNRGLKFKSFQPKASVGYFIDNNSQLYGSVARGYRSGGFNPVAIIAANYLPEKVWTYEAGYKTQFNDNRYSLNLAAFYNDIQDRQLYIFDVNIGSQTIVNPIRKGRAYGFEADFIARPADGLTIDASLGYLKTKIESYNTALFANTPGRGDYTGNEVPLSPELSYSFAAQYEILVGGETTITPRLEINGFTESWWEVDNVEQRKGVNLVAARITANTGTLTLSAFVENLFDVEYNVEFINNRWSGLAANIGAAARGRVFGVIGTVKF